MNNQKMEAISKFHSAHQPIRSISLPTIRVHPSSQRVEALLNRLKQHHSQHVSGTISLDADTIQSDLVVLAEFYNCMEELLHSPHNQQALVHYKNGKLVKDASCGSVTLLDACEAARDLLLTLKEHVQTLQSAMRRGRGYSSIESSICAYERFRKKAKNEIAKQLGAMKRMENKTHCFSPLGEDQCIVFLPTVLRDASTITISIFHSLLVFLSMPRLGTKRSSLISKIKSTRLFSSEKEHENNNIKGKNSDSKVEVQGAIRVLETLNASIDGLEGALDCIFRCLVKNRLSFLNMLAH